MALYPNKYSFSNMLTTPGSSQSLTAGAPQLLTCQVAQWICHRYEETDKFNLNNRSPDEKSSTPRWSVLSSGCDYCRGQWSCLTERLWRNNRNGASAPAPAVQHWDRHSVIQSSESVEILQCTVLKCVSAWRAESRRRQRWLSGSRWRGRGKPSLLCLASVIKDTQHSH